jgi:hypothetical protein
MIKKVTIITWVVLLGALLGAETKAIPIPDLMKPEDLLFDRTQMYVTEGTSIFIYSLEDFKLIKKFGKQGEGPKEFLLHPRLGGLILNVQTEDIIINSFGKVSWFTKDGKYKKEIKLQNPLTLNMQPFGKNFVGIFLAWGQEERWQVLNLYDDQLKELKEIHRIRHASQAGKGTRLLEFSASTIIYDNKLFLAWEKDFVIKVFNTDLKNLYTIKLDEKKREVTEKDKEILINFLKESPQTREYFEMMKPFYFPDYYPAIYNIFATGNKIYVMTFWENEAKNQECLILEPKGKVLKRVFLPLKKSSPFTPYPYRIHEGSLYQIVENVEKEEWTLHISKII